MNALIDTNFIVALIVEDDVNHEKAVEIWKRIDKALVSAISVIEFAYFLIKHNIPLDILDQVVKDPKIEIIEITYQDILFTILYKHTIKRYDNLNDLIILSTSRRKQTQLITFDEELQKLTKSINMKQ